MADHRVVLGIPTYNDADTIGETLSRVARQTRRPDRVVFCDNSEDGTREVIQNAAEEYDLKVEILDQQSDGVAGAYNELLDHVSGEYDVFVTLQSDLIVEDDWLEGHLTIHREHPDVDMVNGPHLDASRKEGFVDPDDKSYYLGRNFSVKRGTLEAIDGWDEHFLRGEDWDMRIRLAGADTTVYSTTEVGYRWQREDPYITLGKAKRRPTSVTFLSKYGGWYLGFHPSHVVSDALALWALVALCCVALGPLNPFLGLAGLVLLVPSVLGYWAGHVLLRGAVDGDQFLGVVRKQFLTGISVVYALRRVADRDRPWNRSGFDPENTPRYRF